VGRCGLEPAPSSCLASPLLVAGVAPITAGVMGRSPHTRKEAPWRTILGSCLPAKPRDCRVGPALPGAPAPARPLFRRRAECDAERKFRPTDRTRRGEGNRPRFQARPPSLRVFHPRLMLHSVRCRLTTTGREQLSEDRRRSRCRMVFAKTHRAITSGRHEDGHREHFDRDTQAATLRFLHEE